MHEGRQQLHRVQTLRALVGNACGTMVGTGVYTMSGQMAGTLGYATVVSFLIGLVPTLLVVLVYAALATRYPRANSLSHWLHVGWGSSFLSFLGGSSSTGLYMFAGAGTTMGCTLTLLKWFGISGNDYSWTVLAISVGLLLFCLLLNLWGLAEASRVLEACGYVELLGLVAVVVSVALHAPARAALFAIDWTALPPSDVTLDTSSWLTTVVAGGVFVIFSFGGFETIASQAEETHDPKRTLPRAFSYSILIVSAINLLVMVAMLCVIKPSSLSASPDPLSDVMSITAPGLPRWVFTFILVASAFNSILGIQIHISRTLYGMACNGALPEFLTWTRSFRPAVDFPTAPQPHMALFVTVSMQAILLLFGLVNLGKNCATLLVISFLLANIAYIGVSRQEVTRDDSVFNPPAWVAWLGIVCNLFILYHAMMEWGWRFLVGWLVISAAIWIFGRRARVHKE